MSFLSKYFGLTVSHAVVSIHLRHHHDNSLLMASTLVPPTGYTILMPALIPIIAAWKSRVQWHNTRGRPRHSRRVLEWNGAYVLYDLHLPPATPLPELPLDKWHLDERHFECTELAAISSSVCLPGATFQSNGALVSPGGRYTFVQHDGEKSSTPTTAANLTSSPYQELTS